MPKGKRELPERCIDVLSAAAAIVHAGDWSQASVLDFFETLGPPVVGVRGNVDDPEVRSRLTDRAELRLGAARIGVIHDAGPARGRLVRLRRAFPEADAVVFGHSHLPLLERAPGGFQIFNPGSPTERRRAPTRSMGTLEEGPGGLRFAHLAL